MMNERSSFRNLQKVFPEQPLKRKSRMIDHRIWVWKLPLLLLAAFMSVQCSSEGAGSGDFEFSSNQNDDDTFIEDSATDNSTIKDDTDTGYGQDTTSGGGWTSDTDDVCASSAYESKLTKRPSDIIFILDNSGSMNLEAKWVQENMNGFSQQIAASNVDYRVVVISSYPGDGNGICIDAPLGSGGCPNKDSNPPRFLHVDQEVASNNGLGLFLSTYPRWLGTLRTNSAKHIVIVTDDNASLPALAFDLAAKQLKPKFSDYRFHGIFCYTMCKSAAAIGSVYKSLVKKTGGVSGDLCEQNFTPVFNKLATAVVEESKIACKFQLPSPPAGMQIDPGAVSVQVVESPGSPAQDIPHVADASHCSGRGWYYDNNTNPKQILLCPSTCDWVQTLTNAELNIDTGCFVEVI
jgi:hypothetical protein